LRIEMHLALASFSSFMQVQGKAAGAIRRILGV
jgi:hypothetical protein